MDLSSAEFSEPPWHLQQRPGCGGLATRNARTAAWSARAKPQCKLSPRVGWVRVEAEASAWRRWGGLEQGPLAVKHDAAETFCQRFLVTFGFAEATVARGGGPRLGRNPSRLAPPPP